MTIHDLQKYIFFINVGAIFGLSVIFNLAVHRIESKAERKYFACLLFVLILVCILTILAFYKIALSEYFLLIRGIIQPVLVSITTYYLYFKYLKKETMKPKIKKTKVKVHKIAGDGITDDEPINPNTGQSIGTPVPDKLPPAQ